MTTASAVEPVPMRTTVSKAVDTGSFCLDLLATRSSSEADRLATPAETARWLASLDLPAPAAGVTARDVDRVHALRTVLGRLVNARLAGVEPDPEDIGHVNACAAPATPTYFLSADARGRVEVPQPDLGGVLSVFARDAIHLLTTARTHRLRSCEGCGLVFYDRSPSGKRRWCSMKRCGERTASANYRRRRAEAEHEGGRPGSTADDSPQQNARNN